MNLLETYINSLPIEVPMRFGINSKVKLNYIDIEDRLTRKGDISIKNFFMEFVKIDEDGDPIEREEFSFFKFNAEKLDFAEMNFNDQFNKLLTLGTVLFEDDIVAFEAKIDKVNADLFEDGADISTMADDIFRFNSKTLSKKKPKLRELKGMVETLNVNLNKFFHAVFKEKWGLDNSPEMELLSIVDKKGYKNLPDEADFVALEPGTLVLEAKYLRRKAASEKPERIDDVGDSITEDGIGDLDSVVDALEDADVIGDIGSLDDLEDLDVAD